MSRRLSAAAVAVAMVSLTMTAPVARSNAPAPAPVAPPAGPEAVFPVFLYADCPTCHHHVLAIPGVYGPVIVEVQVVAGLGAGSGRGRVLRCRRCGACCDVIEHRIEHRAIAATTHHPHRGGA